MKKTVSFDFDGTLQKKDVQDYAMSIKDHCNLIIVTHRMPFLSYRDIYQVAEKIGIPKGNINFVHKSGKVKFFQKHPVSLHLDNNHFVVLEIRKKAQVNALDVNNTNWKRDADYIINSNQ